MRLGEGERLSDEARKPLPQGVDPPLDVVAGLAFLLACGFVLVFWDRLLLIGFPEEVAVAGRPLVALRDRSP